MFTYGVRERDHVPQQPDGPGSYTPRFDFPVRTRTFDLRAGAVTPLRSPAGRRNHHNDRIDDEYESDPDQDGEYGEAHANISAAHSAIITKVWRWKSAPVVACPEDGEIDLEGVNEKIDRAFLKLLSLTEGEESSLDQVTHEKATLLHQLVELPLHLPGRLSVARIILQKNSSLLQQKDKDGITPFHKCIKRQRKNEEFLHFFLDKYPSECKQIVNEITPKGSALHLAISSKIDDCVVKMLPLLENCTLIAQNEEGNTALHLALDVKDWTSWKSCERIQQRFGVITTLVSRCPQALKVRNVKTRSPYQHHIQSLKEWLPDERFTDAHRELIEGKGGMGFALKNAYIRSFSLGEAQNLLYGTDSCPMINLDLSELAGRALPIDFLERLNHLCLEDVLKVVHLPLLNIGKPHASTAPADVHGRQMTKTQPQHALPKPQGTIFFHDVFRWLARRGVRKIMSIIVQDDDDMPHGDEHIEQALRNFDVEIFDWKKFDLASETILAAAPNVREITLYTRGNRAVLRSWSAPDGLIMLPKLTRVRLRVVAPIESEERIRFNLEEFNSRMASLCKLQNPPREIRLPRADRESWGNFASLNNVRPNERNGNQGRKETDTWLKAMDFFRPFLENLPEDVERRAPVVRIAILDDGVDVCADELNGRIAQGQSYCRSSSTEDQHSMHFVSGGGHGTAMARLICKVFNKVELLIVKLDGANTGKPTAISAAQGIKWAVSEGVDIISMSWSIMETKDNEQGIVALVGEVEKAHKAGVLMFCAASDEGVDVMQKRVYPASCDGVICIGAAKPSGTIDESVGKQKVDYIVPGKVILESLDPNGGDPQELSGSSVSTALAAGLAGLILFCISINSPDTAKFWKLLHHKRYMEKVLDSLVSQADPHNKLICVNEHFKPEFAEEAWEEGMPPPKIFQGLVKRLLMLVDQ